MQLEMKSRLKHGESHPVLAGAGIMVWEYPSHSTTERQNKYSETSDVVQVNPGDTFRLESGRTRTNLWEVRLIANEAGSWNPQIGYWDIPPFRR